MFRRKRSRSTPPIQTRHVHQPPSNTTPSAASAAAIAFLNKQASNANLSSAAAAAALRSHAATPEPIQNIRTQRMIRRDSNSSLGSPHGSFRQPFSSSVQRRGSNASSMAERTFRSPSPGPKNAPPPLPSFPEEVPPIPKKSHMRTSSLDARPAVSSPTPSNVGRPVNSATRPLSAVQRTPGPAAATPTSKPQLKDQALASGSPRSVNFSRPMSPPPAPSARMVQEMARTRPASSQGFRTNDTQRQRQTNGTPPSSRVVSSQRPASSAGVPPALTAAALAARPTPAPSQNVAKAGFSPGTPSVITASRPTPVAQPPPITTTQPQPPVTGSVSTTQSQTRPAAVKRQSTGELSVAKRGEIPTTPATSASRTTSSNSIPSPTQEQIRAFQTRAAAHLARPLSEAAVPVSQSSTGPQDVPRAVSTATKQEVTPLAVAKDHARSVSQPVVSMLPANSSRSASISPSRSAHFSASPFLEAVKHQPLPRAASPAKSAMKSSSPAPKPSALPQSSAMSDTSDARSVASDEGSVTTQKKRKSVRVSFDEQPAIVGEATTPQTPVVDVLSPQYKRTTTEAWESSDTMAPRPALPSFGSVRDRSTPTPERSISPAPPPNVARPTSSDEVVGAIIAQDFATKNEAGESAGQDQILPNGTDVPSISVVPATPALDEEEKQLTSDLSNEAVSEESGAGSHPTPDMDEALSASNVTHVLQSHPKNPAATIDTSAAGYESDETAELFEDATEDQTETEDETGGFASLDAILESPQAEAAPAQFGTIDETPTSSVATAGPAVEPVSVAEPTPIDGEDWEQVRAYWSGLSDSTKQQLEQEAARAREEKKAAAAAAATLPAIAETAPGKATASAKHTSTVSEATLPPWPDQQYQQSVNTKSTTLRQSMRQPHQRSGSEPTHMKTSMRNNAPAPQGGLRTSMRDRPLSQQFSKPPPLSTGRAAQVVAPAPAQAAPSAQAIALAQKDSKPRLGRTLSNDSSTSESSFRRRRRNSTISSDGGKFSMRRTMRAPAEPQPQPAPTFFGPRPTSPTPSRMSRLSLRSPSPSMRKPMSHSATASVDSSAPSLRPSSRASKGSSFFGLGKSKPKAQPTGAKATSRFKSRFADSSDEDEGDRPTWSSRFHDSDEEEDGPPAVSQLRPVRGIPRKVGRASGDSTDLSDSEGEGAARGPAGSALASALVPDQQADVPSTPTRANGSATQGKVLHTGTLREDHTASSSPQTKVKRGFFGFGRKKQAVTDPVTETTASPLADAPTSPAAGQNELDSSTTVAASPSSDAMPKTMRGGASPSNRGRNLLRRLSSSSFAGSPITSGGKEDFPYPPPPIPQEFLDNTAANRPNTSDGASFQRTSSIRPSLGSKRNSAMTTPGRERPVIVSERTGKKKKFQGLRRMLGVHD